MKGSVRIHEIVSPVINSRINCHGDLLSAAAAFPPHCVCVARYPDTRIVCSSVSGHLHCMCSGSRVARSNGILSGCLV